MNSVAQQAIPASAPASCDASLRERFALDVLAGFSAPQKHLPSRYFYDTRGSKLFEHIMKTPDYYLTGCEFDIFTRHGAAIAHGIEAAVLDVIELGAGDGHKTKVLLSCLQQAGKRLSYMPVDICGAAVATLAASMRRSHPGITVDGCVGDYLDGLRLARRGSRPRLVLFLGSNIGNLDHLSAIRLLRAVWEQLEDGDYLLAGFDLKKDVNVMTAAYNDGEGLTAAFNLNVIRRINTELGGNMAEDGFAHHGFYNPAKGAMESYLISCEEQDAYIAALGRQFHFEAFEGIHMECSCKYLEKDIDAMAANAGFEVVAHWKDARQWFADSLWRARKAG
jgi:dimethylhistidine N-methyltransferase